MKSNNKTLKIILFISILIILFLIIQSTYSKYIEKDEKTTEFKISGWNILVNGINITETNNFSEELNLNFTENENIRNNVLVPTSTGYFTLEIDSTGTDIPFEYDISLGESTNIKDFKIISYKIDDTENPIEINPTDKSIKGIINPTKNINSENKHILTFYVMWYDKDSNMPGYNDLDSSQKDKADNFQDVYNSKSQIDASSTSRANIKIPVNLKVTQLNPNNNDFEI